MYGPYRRQSHKPKTNNLKEHEGDEDYIALGRKQISGEVSFKWRVQPFLLGMKLR